MAGRDIYAGHFVINKTVVQQHQITKTKRWRELTHTVWPVEVSEQMGERFFFDICFSLKEIFRDTYQDFVALLKLDQSEQSASVQIYNVVCHKAAFTSDLEERRRVYERKLLAIRQEEDPRPLKDALRRELTLLTDSLSNWDYRYETSAIPTSVGQWFAVRIMYDPDSKRIRLKPAEPQSANPAVYVDHLRPTSELLTFIAFILAPAELRYLGDIKWWASTDQYPEQKLFVYILDKPEFFQLSRIRVNVADDEEWDFVNLSYDDEVFGQK